MSLTTISGCLVAKVSEYRITNKPYAINWEQDKNTDAILCRMASVK